MTMKFKIKSLLLVFALVLASLTLSSQPPPDATPQGNPVGDEPAPIGSGLVILMALGAGYGVVKMKQRKAMQKQ